MAVTLNESELAQALGVNEELADRLLPVVVELVERYAPVAPESVANESAIRCAAWLADTPGASVQAEKFGDVEVSFAVGQLSALRASGALALLSPWKQRRAGAI